jgi:hypothetical protein
MVDDGVLDGKSDLLLVEAQGDAASGGPRDGTVANGGANALG